MKRVAAPVPSPDGRLVVFSVTNSAYDEKDQSSDLWIVPSDGSSKPRQLTFNKGAESGVAWSGDSRRIAFSAKREGDDAGQVYILDIAHGGEAMRVTSLAMGASGPRFSPDGRQLLFESAVYPGAQDEEANKKVASERKARKYSARVYDSFPIRQWDQWLPETHSHLFVQSLEGDTKPKDLLSGTKLASSPGFAGAPTTSGESLNAVWAPDGKSIVFVARTASNVAAYANVNTHLFASPVTGGEPKQLTTGIDSYTRPVFRPDGRALYCDHSKEGEKLYSLNRIAMFQWPVAGGPVIVTGSFDRSVGSYGFAPDSRTIYLTAEDAGHENLYTVSAFGGEVKPVITLETGVYTGLAIPEKASTPILIGAWESSAQPLEVVRIDPAAKSHRFLSAFNTEKAAALELPPLRHLWTTSKAGKKIHSMVAVPQGFDESKKYPLLVMIHGGPHSMYRDQFVFRWNYHLIAQSGYVVLLTDYTGSTGYGEKFAQEVQGDPLDGPGKELNESADAAIAKFPFIDSTRQAAGGASYGGHLANWLQATTTRYKCLFSHAGLVNLESQWATSDTIYSREITNGGPVWEQGKIWKEQNPIRFAKDFHTPILLSVGERDFRVPMNNTLENWSVLQRLQIPSRLIVFPDENHWVLKGENSRFYYEEIRKWLDKYLKSPS
jgi:dipeptidyl aminopeptidase/acylaminoacyl peptidase